MKEGLVIHMPNCGIQIPNIQYFTVIEHDISGSTFNEKNLIMTIIRWNFRTPSKNRMDTMYKREEGDKLHCMGR